MSTKNNQYEIKNKNLNFTIIPQAIIFDKRLTGNDLKLLCFYISVSINKNYSFYSRKKISELTNISEKTITAINKKLELLKYITIKKRFENSQIVILNNYKSNKDFDNFRRGKNYLKEGEKITYRVGEKLPTNKYKVNNINSDFDLKNKNTYTEQDDIEIAKIKKMLKKGEE